MQISSDHSLLILNGEIRRIFFFSVRSLVCDGRMVRSHVLDFEWPDPTKHASVQQDPTKKVFLVRSLSWKCVLRDPTIFPLRLAAPCCETQHHPDTQACAESWIFVTLLWKDQMLSSSSETSSTSCGKAGACTCWRRCSWKTLCAKFWQNLKGYVCAARVLDIPPSAPCNWAWNEGKWLQVAGVQRVEKEEQKPVQLVMKTVRFLTAWSVCKVRRPSKHWSNTVWNTSCKARMFWVQASVQELARKGCSSTTLRPAWTWRRKISKANLNKHKPSAYCFSHFL